jgi:hypothetical protein
MPKAARQSITTHKPDPSIAALELHKKADQIFFKRASIADERPGNPPAERDKDRASAAAEHAAWELATTEPTTIAGAAALLRYIVDGPAVGLFDLGETAWHETAFRTVATALEKIAARA